MLTQPPDPGSTLSTVLEMTPVVEKIVKAAAALATAPAGQATALPEIKGVRIAHREFDVTVTLTPR